MKRIHRLVTGVLFMVALLLTSAVSASAQQPTPPSATQEPTTGPNPAQTPAAAPAVVFRDDPAAANTLATEIGAIPADAAVWFRINYDTAGNQVPRPTVYVRLLNGVWNGLAFQVWSPERLQGNWWENAPVGRGTQQVLPSCEEPEDEESEEGGEVEGTSAFLNCSKFETNDLTWTGGFTSSGTYYVRLVNPTHAPIIPQLLIGGDGLVECAGANLGLPAIGHVPPQDEPFVQVQCMDVGPGLVEGEGEGTEGQGEED